MREERFASPRRRATLDPAPDIVALLVAEHAELRADLSRVTTVQSGPARREELDRFARRLVQHDTAEESVVYPVVARIGGGDQFRAEVLRQERGLASSLARLLRRCAWHPGGRRTLRKLRQLSELLEHHLSFEEASLVPILLALESDRTRQMMGTWLRYVEAWTPTRPHPHGPQHLPWLVTIGTALRVTDRILDKLLDRRTRTESDHR